MMLLTMEIMSTFLRLIANNLLPVLHTACPPWGSAKGKRTIAAPQYDKTVSPFQNILQQLLLGFIFVAKVLCLAVCVTWLNWQKLPRIYAFIEEAW